MARPGGDLATGSELGGRLLHDFESANSRGRGDISPRRRADNPPSPLSRYVGCVRHRVNVALPRAAGAEAGHLGRQHGVDWIEDSDLIRAILRDLLPSGAEVADGRGGLVETRAGHRRCPSDWTLNQTA